MSAILRLVEYRNDECIAVLDHVSMLARSGKVRGVAICYTTCDGEQEPVFAGSYRARPGDALHSVMQLSWRLTQHHKAGMPP